MCCKGYNDPFFIVCVCVLCSSVRVAAQCFITQQIGSGSGSVVSQSAHVGRHVVQNRVHYVAEESGTHSDAQGVRHTAVQLKLLIIVYFYLFILNRFL